MKNKKPKDNTDSSWKLIPAGELQFVCGATQKNEKLFEGGCGEAMDLTEAYRCTDCCVYFHRDCAYKHFGLPTANEQRAEINADIWQPHIEGLAKEGKEHELVSIVYNLIKNKGVLKG